MGSLCSKCGFGRRGEEQTTQTPQQERRPSQQTHSEPLSLTPLSTNDSSATQNTRQQMTQDESSQGGTSSLPGSTVTPLDPSLGTSMVKDNLSAPLNDGQQVSGPTTLPVPQSPSSLPLWDSNNPDQQEIVARSAKYKDLLKEKLPDLTEFVQLSSLWPHLIAFEVINRLGRDRILHDVIEADAVERLVDHLERGMTWKLHGFLRALAKTQQQEIIYLLGLEPADYEDHPAPCQPPSFDVHHNSPGKKENKTQKVHYYKTVQSEEMIQISNDLLPGVLLHCGSYNQTLMKTSLFGYQKNIPIDLTRIYVCQDASCKQNRREKMPVGKKELFQCLFGTRCPNCLSLEGPAGTGKSSYLEEYAYNWSQDVTSCEQKGLNAVCEGHMWKLIVYIPAGGIRGTAADAIKGNLRCKPHTQDQMMHAIEDNGDGVLIMYDAMDELHLKESIESISTYIKTSQTMVRKPKVLVSARDGLLSVERSHFDRELHLDGFSLSQAVDYMQTYFKEMHSLKEHPVLEYVKANSQDLEWVLSNPLRVHIFCELAASGFLTLQDLKTLTTVKLFRSLDSLLLQRDNECRPTQSPQTTNFYQACLRCLLTDHRILSEEDVGKDSPYLSLLQRHTHMDKDFHNYCNFSFPHEMLFEYFSMRGLIECLMSDVEYKQGMLLWLCSNKKMRNVLQLTCGYIVQYEPQLLPDVVFIIRACLIFQPEYVWCEQNELTQELLQLPAVIQQTFPPNILNHGLTAEQTTVLSEVFNQIQALFSEKADLLRECAWFVCGYGENEGIMYITSSPFHKFLLGCLQQLTSQQQQDVCSQTITRLLPCTRCNISTSAGNRNMTVFNVGGGIRWAAVRETPGAGLECNINVWSPCDKPFVLNTWSHLPRVQQLLQQQQLHQQKVEYTLYIDRSARNLCTSLPADPWSEEQWTPGLRELLLPRYCTGEISVHMGYSIPQPPLRGLLSACRKVITPGHGLIGGLNVPYGQVTEEELTGFCTWAGQVGLRLELCGLTVVLRAGHGEENWKNVDSAIRRMVEVDVGEETGYIQFLTYVTPGGEVLCERYNPDYGSYSETDSESESEYSDFETVFE